MDSRGHEIRVEDAIGWWPSVEDLEEHPYEERSELELLRQTARRSLGKESRQETFLLKEETLDSDKDQKHGMALIDEVTYCVKEGRLVPSEQVEIEKSEDLRESNFVREGGQARRIVTYLDGDCDEPVTDMMASVEVVRILNGIWGIDTCGGTRVETGQKEVKGVKVPTVVCSIVEQEPTDVERDFQVREIFYSDKEWWGTHGGWFADSFLGMQGVSLKREDLTVINPRDFILLPKIDGTRAMVVLEENALCLMLRNARTFEIQFREPLQRSDVCRVVLDVELISGPGVVHMVILDVVHNGDDGPVLQRKYVDRLEVAREFRDLVLEAGGTTIRFSIQEEFKEGRCRWRSDGLVIMPRDGWYVRGYNKNLRFYKQRDDLTVDCKVIEQNSRVFAAVWGGRRRGMTVLKQLDSLEYAPHVGKIVEFSVSARVKFKMLRVRGDKLVPNSLKTYESLSQSYFQGVTKDELLDRFWL